MLKKIFSIFLLLMFGFYNLALAEENWMFSAPTTDYTNFSTTNTTPYSNYSNQNNNNIYYYNDNEYSLSGRVNTTQPIQTTSVSKENKNKNNGSFTENHPVLTGIGVGAVVLGALALGIMASSNDYDRHEHHHHNNHYPPHHRNGHHNSHHGR